MNYETSTAYVLNNTSGTYEKSYPITNIGAVFTDDAETTTLADKISTISLNSQILWKVQSAGKEAIYSTIIEVTLSTGVKAILYSSWDWYIYCRNANTGALIWRYATGAPCYGRCQASDVNGDGKVEIFGASHDGYVYCLDESGNKLWSFANLYTREGTGAVSSAGTNYIIDTTKSWNSNSFIRGSQGLNASIQIVTGTGNGQTLEISSVTNNQITTFSNWTTTPDSTSTYKIIPKYSSDINYQHAGTLSEENNIWYLYVTGFDGQLVKLNASTGTLVWKYGTLENIEPFPYVIDINSDGIIEILIACLDKHVYCIKSTDGSLVWNSALFSDGLDAFLEVKDIDDDSYLEVLASCRDNRVHILNGITGVEKSYTRDTQGDIDCKPFVSSSLDKQFVCGSDSGYIFGYDSNCECLWGYKTTDATNTSMVSGVLNNELILIQGDQSGALHFLDTNGKLIKVLYLRGGIEGTPVIEQSTDYFTIYLTTIDGWVYSIKIS